MKFKISINGIFFKTIGFSIYFFGLLIEMITFLTPNRDINRYFCRYDIIISR